MTMTDQSDLFAGFQGLTVKVKPREPTPATQQDKVLRYIQTRGSITALQAMQELRIYRLAARINELREMAWPIKTLNEQHDGGSHARYVLLGD
mgnify:CR=1 FL=1|tara:strand:- start:6499 stop:6777 length:279 start_codon:yes stop_codon:yes gene_type:complete